ncbi:MAG TPA: tetratricopeptide repeat protein, partial [Candidatus Baltobacteraceae bacterium]|nr:tetratricopeptide repeat protein [Candidatus Baltobacteraceae bacterium]
MNVTAVVAAAALAAATSVHLPVSTTNLQAQAAVDRALFLYYAYNGDAAAQSFSQAAATDPRLAMAYWGLALASGPDLNTPMTEQRFAAGARAIRQAVALESNAAPEGRRLIALMALRYKGSFSNWADDDDAYRSGMLAWAKSSSDTNVALLAAEALLERGGLTWSDGAPATEQSRNALALVDGVLRDDPSNPMANHLCIHLYDLAPQRAPALSCAQRLDRATFAPPAEHLAHMPAHYWIETGDYAAALASSARAYALTQEPGGGGLSNRYFTHDVAVGYSAAMMLGNSAVARQWSQRMNAALNANYSALTALRFGDYAAAYAASGNQYAESAVRGLAAIQLHKMTEARAMAVEILKNGGPKRGYLPQLFLARLAEEDGNDSDALRWIDAALANQRNDYSGEQIPYVPAGEALGAHFLRRGDNAQAIAAFQATLAAYPNDPRALFGLASAMAADGQRTQAVAVRA